MLAILATHPIQYQVPIWKEMAVRGMVPFEVWYLTAHGVEPSLDEQFGKVFKWDVDLLSGYPHRFPSGAVSKQLMGFWKTRLPAEYRAMLRKGTVTAIFIPGWNVLAWWEIVIEAHRNGIPVWIRGDSNDLKRDSLVKRLVKRILIGAFLKRVDRALCVGAANRRLYRSYGLDGMRLAWGPHAVDNSWFAEAADRVRPHRTTLRQEWQIPAVAFCVLFIGKFIPKKRPTDVVAAIRLLSEIDPRRRYHLLFVGAGELGSTLRSLCRVAFDADPPGTVSVTIDGQAPAASFAGFLNQSQVPRAYVAADALVLGSDDHETWGLVVNEALASGLPCVVSESCGCAEDLVVPLDPQLRFPAGDQSALARAIKHLADHPLSREVIAKQIAKYDFEVTVETLEGLWRELPTTTAGS
jgi:glycosyltransferase involved in cell wall biosynthesis